MPTPIDPKRLPRLKAALKKFGPEDMAPQQALAEIYGVSNARFTTLARERFEGFPEPERRGDKTHWFPAARAIEAMIAYTEGRGASKAAAASKAAEIMHNVKAAEESAPTRAAPAAAPAAAAPPTEKERPVLGPAELDRLANAALRTFRLAQEKKQFVRADQVRSIVRTMFSEIQRSVSSIPMEIDPNGELPPLMRGRLEQSCNAILDRIYTKIGETIDLEEQRDAS